jgi:hypothetical protein
MTTQAGESAALSRDLADFLIELSIALHKNAIYPGGHPLLDTAVGGVERRLAVLLHDRPTLSLGVARHQLIIEGVATDGNHPLLRELAQRLHRHHLGAVQFQQGVTRAEIADFLRTVSEDAVRSERPLGLHPAELQRWQHVRLFPLTYEQLQLLEEGSSSGAEPADDKTPGSTGWGASNAGATRSAQLWIGLARAALTTEHKAEMPPEANDPVVVAKAIDEHGRDQAYDQVVVGYLLQIAEELKGKRGREAQALQKRISRLVGELRPETLRRLLEMGGDMTQRRRFVLDAAQGMAVDAVVDIVQAAAETSEQTVSHSMLRLLSKFAVHAESGTGKARPEFDSALRDQVGSLMKEWNLADPNPGEYGRALEQMSRAAPLFDTQDLAFPLEAERMAQMALEVGSVGDALWRAIDDMVGRGKFLAIFELLDRAPPSHVIGQVIARVATADRVRELTEQDTLPLAVLERLCRALGLAAVEPLLDAYDAGRHQRPIADLLPTLGEDAAAMIIARLDGARAQSLRALLQLLHRFERLPQGWSARGLLLRHADAEVRREALKLELRDPALRDDAIHLALVDLDERVVRAAMAAAMTGCPAAAVPTLMRKADDAELPDEVRVGAVRVLAVVTDAGARDWLVSRVTTRAGLMRRVRLAPRTPVRMAALLALATSWGHDPAVAEVLELARRSADAEIRAAAATRGRRPTGAMPTIRTTPEAAPVVPAPSDDASPSGPSNRASA